MSKSGDMSKSGIHLVYFYSLAPLGPLGLIGAHVSVTKVWGTLIEAYFHLLHLHASVQEPHKSIPTI